MSLRELQEQFWRLVTAPEPVDKALPHVAERHPGVAPLSSWVLAADEATAVERLNVYANGYFFRLHGVLRDDYPDLVKLVGDAAFHNLATGYLLAFPSRYASIRQVGRHLAEHLEGHALAEKWPALPDLARLEWARGDSFDCADSPVLTTDELAAVPPQRWARLRFEVQSGFRVLRLAWPVHRLWLALERGEAPPELEAQATEVLIWRQGFKVYHRAGGPGEAGLLEMVRRGAPFEAICAELHESKGDAAAQAAVTLLRTWIDQQILSAIV